MPIVSMSLDAHFLKRFDDVTRHRGHASRSEALREAMRDYLDASEWNLAKGESTLIVAVVYEMGAPRGDLIDLQHRFPEIRTMLHTHLDAVNCLELVVAEGPSERLKELVSRVRRIRAVKQIKFMNAASNL